MEELRRRAEAVVRERLGASEVYVFDASGRLVVEAHGTKYGVCELDVSRDEPLRDLEAKLAKWVELAEKHTCDACEGPVQYREVPRCVKEFHSQGLVPPCRSQLEELGWPVYPKT